MYEAKKEKKGVDWVRARCFGRGATVEGFDDGLTAEEPFDSELLRRSRDREAVVLKDSYPDEPRFGSTVVSTTPEVGEPGSPTGVETALGFNDLRALENGDAVAGPNEWCRE